MIFKTLLHVSPLMKGHELGGYTWVVLIMNTPTSIDSHRQFRSKRKAFKWAAREAARVGGVVREFHRMTSRQRKAYWRKVSEVAE